MTIKKSLISVAAATLIVAGVTGCGGSSSSSTATTSTPTGAVTSIEVVDGKVLNANAVATYIDENNDTQTLTLERTRTSTNVIDGNVTKGAYAYTIPEANISLADSIRFITITADTAEIVDGESYPASFIDTTLNGVYDVNGSAQDIAYTKTLIAPKGFEYATPVSTLVYGIAQTNLAADELNTTALDNAIATIAAKLNLTADTMQTVDPLQDGQSEYGFVNAMLAAVSDAELLTLGATLTAVDANATDFSGVIDALADSVTSTTIFTTLKTQVDSGALTTDVLSTINFDATRDNGGTAVLTTASTTAIGNISNITVDSKAISTIANTGDKVANDAGSIVFTFASDSADESNATGTVDLLISVTAPQWSMENDVDGHSLVIKVSNIDVNKVDGVTTLDYNSSKATTSYEFYNETVNADANYVAMSDKNSSIIDISAGFAQNTINVAAIMTAVDTNLSSETNITSPLSFAGEIATIKVAIVDADGLLQQVDNDDNAKLWTTTSVAGQGNAIIGTGKTLLNLKADMRGTSTEVNAAPTSTLVSNGGTTGIESVATDATPAVIADTVSVNGTELVYNYGSGDITELFTTAISGESGEVNSTATISGYPSWIVPTVDTITNPATDINLTIDTNATVTGHDSTLVTIKFADEFGKTDSANDANVTFIFNHAPTASTATKTVTADINGTTSATGATSYTMSLTDVDGVADLNASASNLDDITLSGSPVLTFTDGNTSAITATLNDDGTMTFNFGALSDQSSPGGVASTSVIFTVKDVYGAESSDFNITLADVNVTVQ